MTEDEAVVLIKNRLKNTNDDTLDPLIKIEMEEVRKLLELEAQLPWFLKTAKTSALVAGVRDFVPDATFLRRSEGVPMYVWKQSEVSGNAVELKEGTYAEAQSFYKDAKAGEKPLAVVQSNIVLEEFKLFPDYTEDINVQVFGYYSANIVTWLTYASDLVLAETGVVMALNYTSFTGLAEGFQLASNKARDRISKLNTMKEEEQLQYVRGGRD